MADNSEKRICSICFQEIEDAFVFSFNISLSYMSLGTTKQPVGAGNEVHSLPLHTFAHKSCIDKVIASLPLSQRKQTRI